jgi:hypothetical protein
MRPEDLVAISPNYVADKTAKILHEIHLGTRPQDQAKTVQNFYKGASESGLLLAPPNNDYHMIQTANVML